MLLTVARRYMRDADSARDILQEAFIRIFQAIDKYRATGSFEGWMRRIVITTALKTLDRSWFRRELPGLECVPTPALEPEVFTEMGAEELMQVIARLPEGFRQVFNLYVVEGYSHQEIGELLGIAESTSRSQLSRARQLLQVQIMKRESIGHESV